MNTGFQKWKSMFLCVGEMNATEHLWFIHEWVWQPFLGQGWFTHVCYKTITFQVMAWWRQAPIHYLSQCWQTLKLLYYMESLSHNELTHWGLGAFQKHLYELLNPRALKISMSYKNRIFQCKDKIFCVEFQRFPLKFHQCRQKTLLVHQTFVWWTLYILYKFGKLATMWLGETWKWHHIPHPSSNAWMAMTPGLQ